FRLRQRLVPSVCQTLSACIHVEEVERAVYGLDLHPCCSRQLLVLRNLAPLEVTTKVPGRPCRLLHSGSNGMSASTGRRVAGRSYDGRALERKRTRLTLVGQLEGADLLWPRLVVREALQHVEASIADEKNETGAVS